MHSFRRLLIVRLCFTINLMHREVVLEMDNATGDNERKQLSLLSKAFPGRHCRAD